ncbi:uncharacterized mitochondrial protein AtMg00810-like [Belonocnema kinseyi]|uniref:uncharacterized mitochondrial protein AtMg00810-like n=1 Tax=Belonocnema kinseyi TaxID=2817044 RepID=UPI00143D671E|nr:uncharacterized mitochondrial protein AtMg00810-like [Belonocnema kinseyi]
MFIHQTEYARKIVEKFGIADAKPVSVPADMNAILCPADEDDVYEGMPYREVVGLLMFFTVVSRPDIAFAINSVSKFFNKHNFAHSKVVKRIFAYLIGVNDLGLLYRTRGNEQELVGSSDADYASAVPKSGYLQGSNA